MVYEGTEIRCILSQGRKSAHHHKREKKKHGNIAIRLTIYRASVLPYKCSIGI